MSRPRFARRPKTGSVARAGHDPLAADGAGQVDRVQQAYAQKLAEKCRVSFSQALERPEFVRGVLQETEELLQTHDRLVGELELTPAVACERGCVHCCYNHVSLTPPEALYLGVYLEERCSAGELRALDGRVEQALELVSGKSRREIGDVRHRVPCPLLQGETCMAHPARPLVCRGWNSVNAGQCRSSVEEQDPMLLIENHPLPRALAESIQLGMLHASREHGLEAGFLVLARAIWLMRELGVERCTSSWLKGEPFFAHRRRW